MVAVDAAADQHRQATNRTTDHVDEAIQRMLRALRADLGLDVAFVSQFRDGARVFRYVDADTGTSVVQVDGSDPVEESSCHDVVRGALPEVLPDPAQHPLAARIPATSAVPVGTHLSVPIRFSDGTVYGTFCCFSTEVEPQIDEQSLIGVRLVARVVAEYLEERHHNEAARRARRQALRDIEIGRDLVPAFQPIVHLASGTAVGLEALARFPALDGGPAVVFADAWALGVGPELELKAARAAFEQLPRLPPDMYLSVNASPALITSGALLDAVPRNFPGERLVVEVTEHAVVEDYDELLPALGELRCRGVRLAVDDVGAGFSGLSSILQVEPDVLKLDATLVRDVDGLLSKQAMVSALVSFAARSGPSLVAEGVESVNEMGMLRNLGVGFGQGYHLGRPALLSAGASVRP
jgi:EAL domain-containing protein (putative c-di-GMP-specific phosphodiesterase class I)